MSQVINRSGIMVLGEV